MSTGALAAAAVLSVSSSSFACVIFTGRMEVTGGGGTSTSVGARTNPSAGLQYCTPPTDGADAAAGGAVTVTVSPAADCLDPLTGTNQLRDGTYEVGFLGRAYAVRRGVVTQTDQCFFPDNTSNARLRNLGTLGVSGGAGTGTFAIPTDAMRNGPNNRAAVCIREQVDQPTFPSSAHGNAAPVTIL